MRSSRSSTPGPFLIGVYAVEERLEGKTGFPVSLPFVAGLDLAFDERPTILVGENGCGKSTLLEALAELVGLPWDGGSANELASSEATPRRLAEFLRPRVRTRPRDKYFFRAEALSDFGRLLDAREADPDFQGDPYALYGGRSIRGRSHGEAARLLLSSRDRGGLFILDEPEAALSPGRQVEFVRLLEERMAAGGWQFIIASHSPIMMSIAGARLIDMNAPTLPDIAKTETAHWKTYSAVLGAR